MSFRLFDLCQKIIDRISTTVNSQDAAKGRQMQNSSDIHCANSTIVVYNKNMAKKTVINLARLQQLMSDSELDITGLAGASGVSYDTIWAIQKGKRPNTSSETLKKLARALHVSPNDLLTDPDAAIPQDLTPREVRRVAAIATRLSEAKRAELLRMATMLEELEAKEAARLDSPEAIQKATDEIASLGANPTPQQLIQVLKNVLGNVAGQWLIDLGDDDSDDDSPDDPPEDEE